MANPEHLEILNQGVEVWNQWRRDNPEVIPDLSDANLYRANLRGAKLKRANLRGANLSEVDFYRADLRDAKLRGAYLKEANLSGARIRRASLIEAQLLEAKLVWASLRGANLREANLRGADLRGADCFKVNLSTASLRGARLITTRLDSATLTGARLWETQRAGWSIKGVLCEYVYWDIEEKEKSVYSPGEFERLFSYKPIIRVFYKDGISPLEIASLPALIQHIEASHTECKLRFKSIEDASGGAIVTLAIDNADGLAPEYLDKLRQDIQSEVQREVHQLRQSLAAKGELIQRLNGQVESLQWTVKEILTNQKPTYYLEKGDIQVGDTYQNYGQTGAQGHNAHAHDINFNQVVNNFDFPALATQLAELRQAAAEKQDSSPQTAAALGKIAEAEIAAQEKNPSKVMESLKAAGQWTLDLAKEVGKDVVVEAIKLSMGMQ